MHLQGTKHPIFYDSKRYMMQLWFTFRGEASLLHDRMCGMHSDGVMTSDDAEQLSFCDNLYHSETNDDRSSLLLQSFLITGNYTLSNVATAARSHRFLSESEYPSSYQIYLSIF